MKKTIALILFLWSPLAFASYNTERSAIINEYDPSTGYYYKSWTSDERVTNIFVYNPATHSGEMLFQDGAIYDILDILYESGYSAQERKMEFGGQVDYSPLMENNSNVSQRAPKNKLLIVTTEKNGKEAILWTTDKAGKNLKKILTVDYRDDWHLDVKNSKIRVVKKDKNTFIITEVDW